MPEKNQTFMSWIRTFLFNRCPFYTKLQILNDSSSGSSSFLRIPVVNHTTHLRRMSRSNVHRSAGFQPAPAPPRWRRYLRHYATRARFGSH